MENPFRPLLVSLALASALVAHAAAPRPFTPLKLGQVRGLAFDQAGNLFVADSDNLAIRLVTPRGEVTTVVGVLPPR